MSRTLSVALAVGMTMAGGCASTTSPSPDQQPSTALGTPSPRSVSTGATPGGPTATPGAIASATATAPAPIGSPADETQPLPPIVDAFGFSPVGLDGSDATYAAVLTNPNLTWATYRMEVLIDYYSSDETFLAGEELSVTILPGQTTAVAGQSFGAGQAARMEVRPPDDTSAYVPFDASTGTIEIGPVTSAVRDGVTITGGSVTSGLPVDQTFLQLAAVYRAADGTILGGTSGGLESIASGASADFEIVDPNVHSTAATTEVYWQIGGVLW